MLAYILNRLAQSAVVLVLLSIVAFGLVLLIGRPGQRHVAGSRHGAGPPAARARVRPGSAGRAAVPDLSWQRCARRPGTVDQVRSTRLPLILSKLPLTLVLAITACALAVVIGIPLGVLTGVRPNGVCDMLGSVFALAFISVPSFWLGLILILVRRRLLSAPAGGRHR